LEETAPSTNLHADGAMKCLQVPQFLVAFDAVWKWTADCETLAVALARAVACNEAAPATRPLTSMARRDIGDNSLLEGFCITASLLAGVNPVRRRRTFSGTSPSDSAHGFSIGADFCSGSADGVEMRNLLVSVFVANSDFFPTMLDFSWEQSFALRPHSGDLYR
jgi:hypothetical protein